MRLGHYVTQPGRDYGIDLLVSMHDKDGFEEAGNSLIQLKATDRPRTLRNGDATFSIEIKHYHSWLSQLLPVYLILYDAVREIAYWQYIQAYFEEDKTRRPRSRANSVTVRFPRENLFGDETVAYIGNRQRSVMAKAKGVIEHGR